MIILDTNELEANRSLDTPALGVLQAVAEATGHSLALPALVIDEFVAHYERAVTEANADVEKAVRRVRGLVPSWTGQTSPLPSPASAAMEHGTKLRQIFATLVLEDGVARAALRREVLRLRPASHDWTRAGSGARDAAIWHTVLRACEAGEQVFFVSRDKRAFGDRQLHPELQDEVTRAGASLTYTTEIDGLLDQLAERREITNEDISRFADQEVLQNAVRADLSGPDLLFEILDKIPSLALHGGLSSGSLDLEFEDAGASKAYAVNDTSWASSRLRWLARKVFTRRDPASDLIDTWITRFRVSTTVLMQLDSGLSMLNAQVTSRSPVEVIELYPAR